MRVSRLVPIILFSALLFAVPFHAALAVTASPDLRSASNFAVLSAAPYPPGGEVTCTTSKINGDVGSSGIAASVVQTGCLITGAIIAPVAPVVLTDFNSAYGKYAAIPCTGSLKTVYLDETLTLTPGVYCNSAAVTFTRTTLTLDGQGHANAVWIFEIGTLGTGALTGTNFSVVMVGGGQPCNVYWWVAQAATMTDSNFVGTILAGAAITVTRGTFHGDALAKAGVTLTGVNLTGCGIGKGPGNGDGECDDKGDKDKDKGDKDKDKGDKDKDKGDKDKDKHGNG